MTLARIFLLLTLAAPFGTQIQRPPEDGTPLMGRIEGTVLDTFGERPLEGVRVFLRHPSGLNLVALEVASDHEGRFVFSDLTPGRYQLATELHGYRQSGVYVLDVDARVPVGPRTGVSVRMSDVGSRIDIGPGSRYQVRVEMTDSIVPD
jgi:hypothetical protein